MLSLAVVCVKSPGSSGYSQTDLRASSKRRQQGAKQFIHNSELAPFRVLCNLSAALLPPESRILFFPTYDLPPTTYHIPSLVSRAKASESQEQECRGGRDPALRDAGGHV